MNTLPLVLFLYGSVFFLISLRIQKICIVDVAWALGFLVVMTHSFFVSSFSTYPPAYFILFFMVAIWSLRLGSYLFFRMIHKPDDWRYLELKKEWGKNWKIHTYLKIFIFQNFLLFLCSSTLWYGSSFLKPSWTISQTLGLVLWFFGFSLETYSDYYLKNFKSNPSNKGKFCSTGPWALCRYPNYLGEIALWFGIYFFVANVETWWTILSPITLMVLILKFSGLPYLEKHMIKYPGYAEYKKNVPTIIPFVKFF